MDIRYHVFAMQYAQERIARAQAERLAKESRQATTRPSKPAWQEMLDPLERPSREDLGAQHNVFLDSMLEPVPLPRWLRGKRRPHRDKLS